MTKRTAGTTTVQDLQAQLARALEERDAALLEVARQKELVNGLRLAIDSMGEGAVPAYPLSAGLGPPPLRYVVADRANDAVKTLVGPLHGLAKRLVSRGSKE